jgi:hypothetical protein
MIQEVVDGGDCGEQEDIGGFKKSQEKRGSDAKRGESSAK